MKKTAEEIIKEFIPNGIVNAKAVGKGNGKPQYKAEVDAIKMCMEEYASQPMSAEQVELLEASKIALHTLDCIEFTRDYGTASKRLESAISKFTAPTVKAEGWVSGFGKKRLKNKR